MVDSSEVMWGVRAGNRGVDKKAGSSGVNGGRRTDSGAVDEREEGKY